MKPVIYQLFVRLFGNTNINVRVYGNKDENGCGKFDDIDGFVLHSLKEFGITHIWYTGILMHAVAADYSQFGIEPDYPELVKGRAGSPYAIKNYFDVDPDLATDVDNRMNEFENLIQRTHAEGIKVIMDFVPNHVARMYGSGLPFSDHPDDFGRNDQAEKAFSADNDFYYLPEEELRLPEDVYQMAALTEYRKRRSRYREFPARASGNDCFSAQPGTGDWYDTVKLNYGIDFKNGKTRHFPTPLWEKMKFIILYWAGKNIDGFRVDMAEMVPVEFWRWLIKSVKDHYPDLLFIAEIYRPELYQDYIDAGFDYLYDKVDFYDTTRNIIENKTGTSALSRCWQRLGRLEKYMLRFLENHDEQRIASPFFAGDPWKAIPAMVLAATMNSGPLMIYFGQEVGEPAVGSSGFSGDDGRTTIHDYWNVPSLQKWLGSEKLNENQLSPDLSDLRNNYSGIIRLCNNNNLFARQGFYDLMWVNKKLDERSSGRVYAYFRYIEKKAALVILNFGNIFHSGMQLFIPENAFIAMNIIDDPVVSFKTIFPESYKAATSEIVKKEAEFSFDIPPFSAIVVFIKLSPKKWFNIRRFTKFART